MQGYPLSSTTATHTRTTHTAHTHLAIGWLAGREFVYMRTQAHLLSDLACHVTQRNSSYPQCGSKHLTGWHTA